MLLKVKKEKKNASVKYTKKGLLQNILLYLIEIFPLDIQVITKSRVTYFLTKVCNPL